MGEKSARKNDAGERETDGADRSAERTQREEETTDGRSDAPDAPTDGVRVAGRAGPSRGQTRTERSGGSRGTGEGYVDYERGPDPRALSERYGMEVRAAAATRLQRLESEFGGERVQRWADEGMSVETMGKPRDMQAFRERQAERSEEIPADVERRNEASRQRNAARNREDGPAGDAGVPDVVRGVVSSPGCSMDGTVQREMEDKVGGEFGDVRIHTGPQAATAADAIGARTFTVGNHVAFNRGEYQPDTDSGKKVLAHELTHVRQQTEGSVSLLPEEGADRPDARTTVGTGVHVQPKLEVSSPDDPAEKEAEEVAQAVTEMDDEGATGTGEDSDASPAAGADSGATDHAETGTDDEGVDSDGPEAEVDSAETESSDTTSGGAGPENETGPADDVQRAPDAGSAGDRVDDAADVDGAAAADGTSRGTASSPDGTAAASLEEATASDSTLSAGGPGDSPNEDGTISVGRRALRTSDVSVERQDSAIEALYDDGPLQAKLAVSQPTDRSEREAERVAEAVVSEEDPATERPGADAVDAIDRQPSGGADDTVDDETEAEIRSVTGGGRPLSASERSFFEPRFGRDFSDVRVHTGPAADEAARSISAEAFTLGSDIVFARGNYRPRSSPGRELLAHELTHVRQQDGGGTQPVHRQETEGGNESDVSERKVFGSEEMVCEAGPLLELELQWRNKLKEQGVPAKERDRIIRNIMNDMQTVASINDPYQAIQFLEKRGYLTVEQAAKLEGRLIAASHRRWEQRREQEVAVQTPSGGMTTVKRKNLDNYKLYRRLVQMREAEIGTNLGASVGYIVGDYLWDDHESKMFTAKMLGAAWTFGTAKAGNNYVKGHEPGNIDKWLKPMPGPGVK